MSERKSYTLDFGAEPPKAEKKGKQKEEYGGTIDAFVESEKEFAKVQLPTGVKLSTVQLGLRNTIERMEKADEVKAIKRKKELYLITKAYSDKRKWKWKIKRK